MTMKPRSCSLHVFPPLYFSLPPPPSLKTDFTLISERGETMWKSHESQRWGVNNWEETRGAPRHCLANSPPLTGTRLATANTKGAPPFPPPLPPPFLLPPSTEHAMNSTTQPPSIADKDVAVGYVLVPFFLVTIIGIVTAVVLYIRRKRRLDRLRHQLLPVYTYDPSEEVNEAEQEMLWREEDTKVVQSWVRNYQQERPLLMKDAQGWQRGGWHPLKACQLHIVDNMCSGNHNQGVSQVSSVGPGCCCTVSTLPDHHPVSFLKSLSKDIPFSFSSPFQPSLIIIHK